MLNEKLKNIFDIKNLNQKKETLFLIIFVFVLFIVFYFMFFLKGSFTKLFSDISETRQMKQDISQTKNDLEHQEILEKRLEKLKNQIDLYKDKLPAEHEIPIILEDLSKMAKDSYVKILGINPVGLRGTEEKKTGTYRKIPIMISAKAGYHELGGFINRIEDADRFMEISDIRINANPKSPRNHEIVLIVTLYALAK